MRKLMIVLLVVVILFYLWLCWKLSIPGTGERESGIGNVMSPQKDSSQVSYNREIIGGSELPS